MREHTNLRSSSVGVRGGFALPELGVLLAMGIVIVCLLAMAASDTRRQAGLHHSLSNLRQIGTLHSAYAADNSERIATFSWTAGNSPSEFPDLQHAITDSQAGANQAVDILRRRLGYTDVPPISAWLPHSIYNNLPLYDYMGITRLDHLFISPGDRVRRKWADLGHPDWRYSDVPKPQNYDTDAGIRWLASSSYELGAVFWSGPDAGLSAVRQASSSSWTIPLDAAFGRRTVDEVAHPSDKAMVFPRYAWFFGDVPLYSANADARTPILAADGAARVRTTRDMNQGFRPQAPDSLLPTIYVHRPAPWEPPLRDGTWEAEIVTGHHRWTRSGLRGRDFNGPEIPWGD